MNNRTVITRPGNPFIAGAALIANMLGVPRDARAQRTRQAFNEAGYDIATREASEPARYRQDQPPFQASRTATTLS